MGLELSQKIESLRDLAEWYRAFAEVGDSNLRAARIRHASYLDRLAAQREAPSDSGTRAP